LTWPAKPPHAKHQPSPTPYQAMPHFTMPWRPRRCRACSAPGSPGAWPGASLGRFERQITCGLDSLLLSLSREQGGGSSHRPWTGWPGSSTSWGRRGEARRKSATAWGGGSVQRSYDQSYGGASHRIAVRPKPSYPGRPAGRENREVWREDSAYWRGLGLVGAGGFEPPNTGSKVPRLTTWPRPRSFRPCAAGFRTVPGPVPRPGSSGPGR